ncbi:MAG: histidine kinase [Frankiales bacterium]|nr:histidine kinase [Frankiales bacterium]
MLLVLLALTVIGLAQGQWADVPWQAALFWCAICGLANLLAAPAAGHTYLSMSAPVNIAIAVLFPPAVAAVLVAVGSVSQLEVQRLTTPLRAGFNRTQIGLCTAAASLVLSLRPDPVLWTVLLAVVTYHLVNWTLVAGAERSLRGTPVVRVLAGFLPRGVVATGTYLSLGAMGVVLGLVYGDIGPWAVALLLLPLAGARQAVRATEDIQRVERERRELADRLVEEREGERLRIASDLHDTVLQNLAAVQVQADNVSAAVQRADPRGAELAGALRTGVDGTISDVRRVIANLRHAGIDGDGLIPTVKRYADAFSRHAGCAVDVRISGPVESLPTPIALLLLESCQEALTNVARHADAGSVLVHVEVHTGQVELRVEDDGRGFASDAEPNGFGLRLTREKLALVGGGCWVSSAPGRGTQVVVRVPLLPGGGGHGE